MLSMISSDLLLDFRSNHYQHRRRLSISLSARLSYHAKPPTASLDWLHKFFDVYEIQRIKKL